MVGDFQDIFWFILLSIIFTLSTGNTKEPFTEIENLKDILIVRFVEIKLLKGESQDRDVPTRKFCSDQQEINLFYVLISVLLFFVLD